MLPFEVHNLFRIDIDRFLKDDPNLSSISNIPYPFDSPLEEEIPIQTPGIYILTGGRQVGKSTLLKQMIRNLLLEGTDPDTIWYLPCDTIERFDDLIFHIQQFQEDLGRRRPFHLFIDEITYVKEWDRAIKSLADAGLFKGGSVLITGSDSVVLRDAMMRFPGRRGDARQHDFHYHPLSFYQHTSLVAPKLAAAFDKTRASFQKDLSVDTESIPVETIAALENRFDSYLMTGGFLRAINDLAQRGKIPAATYRTYIQWIVGDILKRGKQERYLREIVEALITRLTKQVSWHKITRAVSIDHHQTVADYLAILERMDVLNVLYALREDKLTYSPKKDKKIHYNDPFIFHALHAWADGEADPFALARRSIDARAELSSALVEGTVASIARRNWKSFYIKADGEVDIALLHGKGFFPIEIKCSESLRRQDLKQIMKYKRGIVAYRGTECGAFDHLTVMPIPLLAMLL